MTVARATKEWPSTAANATVKARATKEWVAAPAIATNTVRATKVWVTAVASPTNLKNKKFPWESSRSRLPLDRSKRRETESNNSLLMLLSAVPGEPVEPDFLRPFPFLFEKEWPGHVGRALLNRMIAGKLNTGGIVTLTASAATTTLTDELIDSASVIELIPTTANAAAALATTYFSTPTNGSVVINHANNAQADKTFRYTVIG